MSKWFCFPSENSILTLHVKNLLLRGVNSSFQSRPLFKRDLRVQKRKQEATKVVFLVKMTKLYQVNPAH